MDKMYDLAIIGGGQAGYNAGIEATSLGLNTVLIEENLIGGTCLNRGCIPTKSLLKSAEIYSMCQKSSIFGVNLEGKYDMGAIYQRKDDIVNKLRKGIEFLIKKTPLEVIKEKAVFVDKNTLQIGDSTIKATNIIIATGSVPCKLPIPGGEFALNSDDILEKGIDGDEIVIIGGGVIGVEFATIFAKLDKKVTIVEYADRILPTFDKDASSTLKMALKKMGINIFTKAKVIEIKNGDKKTVVTMQNEKIIEYVCDEVVVSVGRKANIEKLGLDNAGVIYDRAIKVDQNCRTNIDNIYSVGDASAKIQLAHYAEAEGLATVQLIAKGKSDINLNIVPGGVYTSPELAMVGRTEPTNEEEILYVGKVSMMANGKANIEDVATGFVKTVYDIDHKLIGGVIVCSRATDMIGELSLAIANGLTCENIVNTIYPHPTLSEAIKHSAMVALSNINKLQ
ncbi:MAG: dihydrolipoyl dehydrogenase [Clostridia bacterium]